MCKFRTVHHTVQPVDAHQSKLQDEMVTLIRREDAEAVKRKDAEKRRLLL